MFNLNRIDKIERRVIEVENKLNILSSELNNLKSLIFLQQDQLNINLKAIEMLNNKANGAIN